MKVTPQDFIKMNEEFEREGTPIRIIVPTQEQIDNPTGVVLDLFAPQPPMPPGKWGKVRTNKEIDDEFNYDTYSK